MTQLHFTVWPDHGVPAGSEISGRHVAKCDYILYKATQTAEVVAISGELASLCAAVGVRGQSRVAQRERARGAGQIAGRAWS